MCERTTPRKIKGASKYADWSPPGLQSLAVSTKSTARTWTAGKNTGCPLPHIVPVLSGFSIRMPWQSAGFHPLASVRSRSEAGENHALPHTAKERQRRNASTGIMACPFDLLSKSFRRFVSLRPKRTGGTHGVLPHSCARPVCLPRSGQADRVSIRGENTCALPPAFSSSQPVMGVNFIIKY